MTRRMFPSLFAAIVVALFAMQVAGLNRAYAQQDPNCCDFMVDAAHIPASCFPVALTTSWAGGLTNTVTFTSPGFYPVHLPFNCPPAPAFVSATVTSAVGCCLRPVTFFCGGCLFIQIVRC